MSVVTNTQVKLNLKIKDTEKTLASAPCIASVFGIWYMYFVMLTPLQYSGSAVPDDVMKPRVETHATFFSFSSPFPQETSQHFTGRDVYLHNTTGK